MKSRFKLLSCLIASTTSGITSSAQAQEVIKGEATHTHLLPSSPKLTYLPPQHTFAPANLIASLTQAALVVETQPPKQTPGTIPGTDLPKQSSGAKAAAVVPRFFANRITYRPSSQAAAAFLHEPAWQQGSTSQAPQPGQSLYREQTSHKLTDPVGPDENALITRDLQLQERKNELTVEITAAFVQVVEALGQKESSQQQNLLKQGRDRLSELCGEGQCQWSLTRLENWINNNSSRLGSIESPELARTAIELVAAQKQLASEAIAADPEIANIRATLGISNNTPTPSEKTLSTLSFVPLVYSSLAGIAQAGVERGSGGSRAQRLAHVLGQGEMLTSRINFLTRQAHLVVQQNNLARQTDNRLLLVFTSDYADFLRGR